MTMTIKTGDDVRAARKTLGLTVDGLTKALRMSSTTGGRTVRRWEKNEVPITGPASLAIEAMLAGFIPADVGGDS